ncbi:unnamed protein product, partial [marine sediment metagenome]
ADVKTIMSEAGTALIGIGVNSGDDRARRAAEAAISSPLLEVSIEGAKGILLNVTGGPQMSLSEVNTAAEVARQAAAEDANIIFGTVVDESMGDEIRVTVVATAFTPGAAKPRPAEAQVRPIIKPKQDPAPPAAEETPPTPEPAAVKESIPKTPGELPLSAPQREEKKKPVAESIDELDLPPFLRKREKREE